MKFQEILEKYNAELISAYTSFAQSERVKKDRSDSGLRVHLKVKMTVSPGGVNVSNLNKELPYGVSVELV